MKILYGEIGKKEWGCSPVVWKEWKQGLERRDGECLHFQIPYNRIRKDLKTLYDAELFFRMVDPLSYLQTTLITWYGDGEKRNAFAFYRTLREQVDYFGLESSISVRTFADWLKAQNPIPLFNPQIAWIDSQKRLDTAKRLLKKDFSSLQIIEWPISEQAGYFSSPLASIDFNRYQDDFGVFVAKDLELYEWIASGAFHDREEKTIPDKGTKKIDPKRPKIGGGVHEIRTNMLKGVVRLSDEVGDDERLLLLLQVNGKILRRKELLAHERDEHRRIPFLFRKLTLDPKDRVELILRPGNLRLNLSPKAKEFFLS